MKIATDEDGVTAPWGASGLLERQMERVQSGEVAEPAIFRDLNLDQIVQSVVAGREVYDLLPFFRTPRSDPSIIHHRQAVFRDLDDTPLFDAVKAFSQGMRDMRAAQVNAEKLHYPYQRQAWFITAVETYCATLRSLASAFADGPPRSDALAAVYAYIVNHVASPGFKMIEEEARRLRTALAGVRYNLNIKPGRIKVSRSDGEADYSEKILATFDRFRQGAVKDHSAKLRVFADMNHIEAGILDLVARLNPKLFGDIDSFRQSHARFVDPHIAAFDRELQFYIGWLEHIAGLRRVGLSFCYPAVSDQDKTEHCEDCFDMALASKLANAGEPVVTNSYHLTGAERIIVVSGPNQGGKTTFARTFGQLHFLASLGCPIPGTAAKLYLPDAIFTHFEREEDIQLQRGKLEDDLERVHTVLTQATSHSLIIMNEIFNSTTLSDATFLSRQIFDRIIELDALAVCVTFIDELSSLGPSTVSMVSTVIPEDPARRSFKIVRRPADGRAYAMALAEKYGLTETRILERIPS